MKKEIKEISEKTAQQAGGVLGVGFKDLKTGEEVYLNGDRAFPMASVYKVFVLCELFKLQKAGAIRLTDRHTLRESEKSIGSGILELIGEGAVFSYMDYVMLMMAISDNTASDFLFNLTGPENIRKDILEPLSLRDTRCDLDCAGLLTNYYGVTMDEYREVMNGDGRFHKRNGSYFTCAEPKNNQTSPRDMIRIFSLLHEGRFIDAETDRQILGIMMKCQTNGRIPAKLPQGTVVAHKTGSIDHLANDCGIVYTDRGDYALALFYNGNLAPEEEYEKTNWSAVGNRLLSQLSADIYAEYMKN